MQYIIPDYYKEFHCIADLCEETCCSGWQIMIDPKSLKKYKQEKGPYRKELFRNIHFIRKCFRQDKEKRCAFLNDNNRCNLYTHLGADSLCKTCRLYPRHIEEFEGVREITLSVSCPEVARILLSKKEPVSFLSYEKPGEEEYDSFDPFLYSMLIDAREALYKILQNRKLPLHIRAILVLGMAHDIQTRINVGQLFDCQTIIDRYQTSAAARHAKSLRFDKRMFSLQRSLLKNLHSLEFLKEQWPDLLLETEAILYMKNPTYYKNEARRYLNEDLTIQLEQLLVYFISTYFCGAVYDGEVLTKAQMAVVCTIQIFDLWLARYIENGHTISEEEKVELLYRYSRETEHSDLNLKRMEEIMQANRFPW